MATDKDLIDEMAKSATKSVKTVANQTRIPATANTKPILLSNLTVFEGYSVDGPTWFLKFTDRANEARWTLSERCQNIVSHMDGLAVQWYRNLDTAITNDYHRFVEEFHKTFGSKLHAVEYESKWRALKQELTELAATSPVR
jgi:hypothetical protein